MSCLQLTLASNGRPVDLRRRGQFPFSWEDFRRSSANTTTMEIISQQREFKCNIVRCLVGNPLKRVQIDDLWRTLEETSPLREECIFILTSVIV